MDYAITSTSEVREARTVAARIAELRAKYNISEPTAASATSSEVENMIADTLEYVTAKEAFTKRLSEARTEQAVDAGKAVLAVGVFTITGRRFDKVMVQTVKENASAGRAEVVLFIHRETGAIFGMKSPMAPNLNHYYGTIYTAENWDWSGVTPVPFDETRAGVKKAKGYKSYTHYVPTNLDLYRKLYGGKMVEMDEQVAS